MENTIQYFKNANWASIEGAFTPKELREIADKIENPQKQEPKKKD